MIRQIETLEDFFEERNKLGIKPGLDRMKLLLESVGQPQKRMKAIHIAGTNGKGSTLTYLTHTLRLPGYRVGSFSSPSLTNRKDMIQLNEMPIKSADFIHYFNKLMPTIDHLDRHDNPPSTFEIIVAIAMQYFAEFSDIAVIEAGMGGKEDATNCFTPILSIITSIGLDHVEFLGQTYESIAKHKAGIIKEQTPVIVGQLPEEAKHVIKQIAHQQKSDLYWLNKEFLAKEVKRKDSINEQFTFCRESMQLSINIVMKGEHQINNACLAVMGLVLLKDSYPSITNNVIQKGLGEAKIIGRFEQIHDNPKVIIDGAHNTASIEALINTVDRYYKKDTKSLLFAAFEDKPIEEMINRVDRYFDHITFTTFEHPRAVDANRLFDLSKSNNKRKTPDWKQALEQLRTTRGESVIIVAGSLDFIGKVRKTFE